MKTVDFAVFLVCLPVLAQKPSKVVPGRFIVTYRDARVPGGVQVANARVVAAHPALGIVVVDSMQARGKITPAQDAATMAQLAAQPDVALVVQDRIVSAQSMMVRPLPNTTRYPAQGASSTANMTIADPVQPDIYYTKNPQDWAVKQVGGYGKGIPGGPATGPWDVTTGTGVRIAILDTGLDANHPDIAPNLTLNLSEVDEEALPSACDDGSPQDQQGHGTFAASLAAAAMGTNTGLMVGVAPTATLLNIKVLQRTPGAGATLAAQCNAGQASGLLSWVIQGSRMLSPTMRISSRFRLAPSSICRPGMARGSRRPSTR